MPVRSVIEAYITAVMEHALFDPIDNGVAATVPEAFGVVGIGADCLKSASNLRERLEVWVAVCLANGRKLPVVDDIDFATESTQNLVPNQPEPRVQTESTFFRNAEEFDAALQEERRGS